MYNASTLQMTKMVKYPLLLNLLVDILQGRKVSHKKGWIKN